jgi:hypothetical protein
LRGVIDPQHLNAVRVQPVNGNIRHRRKQEFSRSGLPSRTTAARRILEQLNGFVKLADSLLTILRKSFCQISADFLKIGGGSGRPANSHSGAQHLFDTGVHLRLLNELSSIRLRDALTNRLSESRVLLQNTQRGILDKLFHIGAGYPGNPRKLRFLLGREVDFHSQKICENPDPRQAELFLNSYRNTGLNAVLANNLLAIFRAQVAKLKKLEPHGYASPSRPHAVCASGPNDPLRYGNMRHAEEEIAAPDRASRPISLCHVRL